jgi:two-component system OmpR family response regulator
MEKAKRLLLVDDDRALSPLLKEYLEAKSFICDLFHNAFDAIEAFRQIKYDLCIFDIRMPFKNGYELATEVKTLDSSIPFLFLTGENDKADKIKGLELGADDYITKPFSMQELYLRVNVILRRMDKQLSFHSSTKNYSLGNYVFQPATREIRIGESSHKLSAIESKLLQMFCEAESGILLRDNALKVIWSDENNFRERSLNVYVSKLRKYLSQDPSLEILNIHGTGYQLINSNMPS